MIVDNIGVSRNFNLPSQAGVRVEEVKSSYTESHPDARSGQGGEDTESRIEEPERFTAKCAKDAKIFYSPRDDTEKAEAAGL